MAKPLAAVRAWFDLGPLKTVILVMLFVVCWGGPLLRNLMHDGQPPHLNEKLATSYGTRGPWVAVFSAETGLTHTDGPPDYLFHVGDWIAWDSGADVAPGVTVNGEATLWCSGRPYYTIDYHLYAGQTRPRWKTFGFQIPPTVPPGQCGVRRHALLLGPDGEREEYENTILSLQVAP